MRIALPDCHAGADFVGLNQDYASKS